MKEILEQLASAVSGDETRQHLCAVHVVDHAGQKVAFSTDGHRMHVLFDVDAPVGSYDLQGTPVDVKPPPAMEIACQLTTDCRIALPRKSTVEALCDKWCDRRTNVIIDLGTGEAAVNKSLTEKLEKKTLKRDSHYSDVLKINARILGAVEPQEGAPRINAEYLLDVMNFTGAEFADIRSGEALDPVKLSKGNRLAIVMPTRK